MGTDNNSNITQHVFVCNVEQLLSTPFVTQSLLIIVFYCSTMYCTETKNKQKSLKKKKLSKNKQLYWIDLLEKKGEKREPM